MNKLSRLSGVSKLLVANRGEIACRVMETARRLGVPTVAVYSKADEFAKHVSYADEAFYIGEAAAKDSYLRKDRIIDVALKSGVSHIHPGYGFLSENTHFAKDCEKNRIKFVGPPAAAILAMGDKIESKVIMEKAGVPLVPGYHGSDQSLEKLVEESKKIGFPVLVKAALGGGGKGMKIATSEADCVDAIESAQREALSSFGDQRVLLEKYVGQPRHIEVQILADSHGNTFHFFERDCSIQRRHQKIVEEAPAIGISSDFRKAIHKAAIDAAEAVGYENAGTVEFLVDADTWEFYFMEMNTRLQVEHPVSESVTGVDLVELQLRVASGEKMPFKQEDIKCTGHAVEVRLYAENPDNDFLPATGELSRLKVPNQSTEFTLTEEVRFDSGVRQGDAVTDYYDPMIAKMITKGKDRTSAIMEMQKALGELQIADLPNNVSFLQSIMEHEKFLEGEIETNFIPKYEKDLFPSETDFLGKESKFVSVATALKCTLESIASKSNSSWGTSDGFRSNSIYHRPLEVTAEGNAVDTTTQYLGNGEYSIDLSHEDSTRTHSVKNVTIEGDTFSAEIDGWKLRGDFLHTKSVGAKSEAIHLWTQGRSTKYDFGSSWVNLAEEGEGRNSILSPMPGRVVEVFVEDGERVEKGSRVLALEAMKMEHVIKAPTSGRVSFKIQNLKADTKVSEQTVLAVIESD